MKLRVLVPVIAGFIGAQAALAATPTTASTTTASTTTSTTTVAKSTITPPTTLQGQISYTIGVDMGQNLKSQSITIDPDMLAQGLRDSMSDNPLLMTKAQMDGALKQFQQQLAAQQQQKSKELASQNAKEGAAFLAKNKTQKGVTTLPSGLQYKIVQPGSGTPPTANDVVTVDYEGAFVNGDVFSSTYKQGQPVSFQVTQVIQGWQQALKMMKPGAEWMLYIPSNLAYGAQGVGDSIGPNAALVFKIHLISVQQPEKPAAQASSNTTTPATTGNSVASSAAAATPAQ
jgi:FKBP-type peptidyl-prolyl cis-trans isomerase FklB